MSCLRQYTFKPRTILVTLIIICLAHGLFASEEKDDEANTIKNNYIRKTRRVMRPLAKLDSSSENTSNEKSRIDYTKIKSSDENDQTNSSPKRVSIKFTFSCMYEYEFTFEIL